MRTPKTSPKPHFIINLAESRCTDPPRSAKCSNLDVASTNPTQILSFSVSQLFRRLHIFP
jgi:hypothetical protein